jgi:hypothetical protein
MCKLNKAFYRLKQAPRAWLKRISQFFMELGLIGSQVDHLLFTCQHSSALIYS